MPLPEAQLLLRRTDPACPVALGGRSPPLHSKARFAIIRYVSLGKLLSFSVPHLPHLYKEILVMPLS